MVDICYRVHALLGANLELLMTVPVLVRRQSDI